MRSSRCEQPPPAELLAGIAEFNAGLFFECHETLEALWVVETDPIRYLYQGILQVGVGFYHLGQGNYKGARSLLRRGGNMLQPFRPMCMGVDVDGLLAATARCIETLAALGPERLDAFDRSIIPKIAVNGVVVGQMPHESRS
ncbi:MAG: DUF309 domain-containing protein [Chloroflexi bacterium]|nr:DUF309 domain-containing protein [Chloroflexota bacterium]